MLNTQHANLVIFLSYHMNLKFYALDIVSGFPCGIRRGNKYRYFSRHCVEIRHFQFSGKRDERGEGSSIIVQRLYRKNLKGGRKSIFQIKTTCADSRLFVTSRKKTIYQQTLKSQPNLGGYKAKKTMSQLEGVQWSRAVSSKTERKRK